MSNLILLNVYNTKNRSETSSKNELGSDNCQSRATGSEYGHVQNRAP